MGESTGRKTVFVGSWNLGSAEPGSGLTSWLAGAAAGADIVALGFQEAHYSPSSQRAARISANGSAALACSAAAAPLHPPALVLLGATSVGYFASSSASSELTCRVHLRSLVHSALELHGHSYRILAQPHLMHMRLLLFARSDSTPPSSLSSTKCHSLSCGALGGSIANKGGLLTRLRLHDRTLAFLSCHLAPHTAGLFQRNVQSRTLLEGLHTDCRSIALDVSTDHVFVFGDLNYRSAPPHITRIFSPGLFQFISSPTLLLPCTCSFNTTTSPSLTGTRAPLNKEDFSRAFHNVLYSIEHDRSSLLALDQLRHEMVRYLCAPFMLEAFKQLKVARLRWRRKTAGHSQASKKGIYPLSHPHSSASADLASELMATKRRVCGAGTQICASPLGLIEFFSSHGPAFGASFSSFHTTAFQSSIPQTMMAYDALLTLFMLCIVLHCSASHYICA